MKRKFILLPISLTALAPAISLVGCGDPDTPEPQPITPCSMTIKYSGYHDLPDLSYSKNGADWIPVIQTGKVTKITLDGLDNGKLWLKGNNPEGFSNRYDVTRIQFEGEIHLQNNVMDLLDNDITTNSIDVIPCEGCFISLFEGSTGLASLPNNFFPNVGLTDYCYCNMFSGCVGLTSLSNITLPSTQLFKKCYRNMFSWCTNLIEPPNIAITEQPKDNCYAEMFSGCSNLKISSSWSKGQLFFHCPEAASMENAVYNMFHGTLGGIETPEDGTSYYWYK